MKNIHFLFQRKAVLAIFTGLLMSIPWYNFGTGLILLFALVPLLYLVDLTIREKGTRFFSSSGYFFLAFAAWAASSGWWLVNATVPGTIFLVILDAVFYTAIILLYRSLKISFGRGMAYLGLVSFWIAFEYLYINAELSVPWINLGHGLAHNIRLVQWYEYTGALGGTLWILLSNILLYEIFIARKKGKAVTAQLISLLTVLLIPAALSLFLFYSYKESEKNINVVSVQPNVDPYEKFVSFTPEEQADSLIRLFTPFLDDSIDYIVTPETAITGYASIRDLDRDPIIQKMLQFTGWYPDLNIILGMTLFYQYASDEPHSPTAQVTRDNIYYDTYNSAVQINRCSLQMYHKSKLFPGVESMPYANALKFLNKMMINLGGTYRSHGISPERTNLYPCNSSVKVAPVICWEDIYGEFVTGFIKNGADVIFNITNEGWWGNTPGHKMFMKYAKLRAIETRRSMVRSANTGISAFISPRGITLQELTWGKKGVILAKVSLNDELTCYVKHGDFLGRWFEYIALLPLLLVVAGWFRTASKAGKRR